MKKINSKHYDVTISFLQEHEAELLEEISVLQSRLTHTKSLINKRIENVKTHTPKSRDMSVKADMKRIILETLQTRKIESSSDEALPEGLPNSVLYKYLIQSGLEINEATFRVYLKQYKDENLIEKKGGRTSWTLVKNKASP